MGSLLFNIDKFSKIDEFRQEAINFTKTGMYCNYPKGTLPFKEYWEKQHAYCKLGYTNSEGINITGPHYFYLNFVQILAQVEINGVNKKMKRFPDFLDIDFDYFHIVEKAKREQKGVCLVKPRRTGFSYKNAALITHEYNFYRDSKCIIGSFLGKLAENTMNMVLDNMNFLDTYTEWKKQRNPDTKEFVKARFKETTGGVEIWKGYMSEVHKITFKDNPFASVGKTSSIFIFEEAGTFDNLIQSYNITEPCWKDGDSMIGIPIVFGTGGDMEGGTRDFHEMFYNPEKYNMVAFDNIWDAGKEGTKCGWFIPATRGRLGKYKNQKLMDAEGNSQEELAAESIETFRNTKRKGDPKAYKDAVTQYPLTPQEAFLRSKGGKFPIAELEEHLAHIETSVLKDIGKVGELYFNAENKIKFRLNPDIYPILDFPLKDKTVDKRGALVIYEDPDFESDQIPFGLYIAGCDPYDQDQAENTTSLGSIFIYKNFYRADKLNRQIVAEYTGRPEFAVDFYETCRKLLMYYNAKVLYENNLKGIKQHFEHKHCLHLLYEQPQLLKDMVKNNTTSNRGYGMPMSKHVKIQCEIFLKDWLLEEREDLEGKKILNLHTILSVPLLKELINYDDEGNFDRVIAFMLCVLQEKENYEIQIKDSMNVDSYGSDPFFKRKLFKKHTNSYFN